MRFRHIALALVGVIALSFGAAACGGDGNGGSELTLEEYFSQLETLAQNWDDAGTALDEQAGMDFDAAESEEEAIGVFAGFLEDAASLTDEFVSDIEDLNPPAAVADAHDEAVTAGQEVLDMFDNIQTVLETVETFEDATALMEGPGFTDASERFTASCFALEDIASENDITIDLRCGSPA